MSARQPEEPILRASGLGARYRDRVVLSGVEWTVAPGEFWAVLGPNGAGKSTLVRACLGMHVPADGQVRLWGRSLGDWDRAELARKVAWVPQELGDAGGFTVLELALMGRSPHLGLWGVPSSRDEGIARGVLAELGLEPVAARLGAELSGGELRLVLLARALVQEPELLLLDEPTAFLDLRHQMEVLRLLRERTRRGLAVVAVLHDANLAAAFADRVLLVKDGKVRAQGPVREVLTGAYLEQLFGCRMIEARAESGQTLFGPERASA